MSHGGKGDRPRPYSVDRKTYENNWDAIFGDKQKQQEEKDTQDGEQQGQDQTSDQ